MRVPILFAGILTLILLSCNPAPEELNIGAAPVVMKVLDEVAKDFKGCKVNITYAPSGQIAQQVRQGAPLDLLILADKDYIETLAKEGFILEGSIKIYARTSLVVWVPEGEPRIESFEELASIPGKIAIANPDYSPYGQAAGKALKTSGLWGKIKEKIVYAEGVHHALQLAETKNASAALVPLPLVLELKGHYILVPKEFYTPPEQSLAIVKGTKHEVCARKFIAYLLGPENKRVFEKYGFEVPED